MLNFLLMEKMERLINIQVIKYSSYDEQTVETVTLNASYEGTYSVDMNSLYQVVFAITSRYAAASDEAEVAWTATTDGGEVEEVTLFEDNFDSYADGDLAFGEWTTIDGDGAAIGGINNYEFPHSGEPIAWTVVDWSDNTSINAASGNNTVATMYNNNQSANDDWLISPVIDLTGAENVGCKG